MTTAERIKRLRDTLKNEPVMQKKRGEAFRVGASRGVAAQVRVRKWWWVMQSAGMPRCECGRRVNAVGRRCRDCAMAYRRGGEDRLREICEWIDHKEGGRWSFTTPQDLKDKFGKESAE